MKKGNTKLPFGLCEKYGIVLSDTATPRDAWNALKKKTGLTPKNVYSALEKVKKQNDLKMRKTNNALVSKKPIPKMTKATTQNMRNNLVKTKKLLGILLELQKAGILLF